jgi:hypothetical protein
MAPVPLMINGILRSPTPIQTASNMVVIARKKQFHRSKEPLRRILCDVKIRKWEVKIHRTKNEPKNILTIWHIIRKLKKCERCNWVLNIRNWFLENIHF